MRTDTETEVVVPDGLTVERAMQLLESVKDPVLKYDPNDGITMLEHAGYNKKVHQMLSVHGLIPVIRQQLEPMRTREEEEGYCEVCVLLDSFLVEDPDPRLVGA